VSSSTHEHNGQLVTIETRRRTSTLPQPPQSAEVQQQCEADRRSVEVFQFDHGRYPNGPNDGEAWQARRRMQKRSLRRQVQTPPQRFEPDHGQWRRWTAALTLGRINRAETAAPPRPDNGREPRTRRQTARRGGDSGDREPDLEPPGEDRRAVSHGPGGTGRAERLRVQPALMIEIEYEAGPRVVLLAGTFEDERRLRSWLAGSSALRHVGELVRELQESLEEET
jgi:hypothetical protein